MANKKFQIKILHSINCDHHFICAAGAVRGELI